MKEFHSKIEEALKFPDHGTIIDGVFCSEAIDTSGEMIDLKEMDITSLNDGTGVANTEHINPEDKQFKEAKAEDAGQWAVIVGRIVFAKKIFKKEDCESDRELKFWNEVKLPFLYGAIELFDADGHLNAQELAAQICHYHKRNLPVVARYSIEGSTLDRDGHILKPTIARRVAVTIKPCNQAAASSLVERTSVPVKHSRKKELSKKEATLGVYETESFPLIQTEKDLVATEDDFDKVLKAMELGGGAAAAPTSRTGMSALVAEEAPSSTKDYLEKRRKTKQLKARLFAAIRDWDRVSDFKKHLKHHLKDVHDSYIDKFSEMAEDISLGKRELIKKEIEYKGNFVDPGEIQILAGPFAGSTLPLLHLDDNHAHVQSFKAGGQHSHVINRLPMHSLGRQWAILSRPTVTLKPNVPEEIKELNQLPEQSMVVYKLDLSKPLKSSDSHSNEGAGWFLNGFGKKVYLKPEIESIHDECKSITTAEREALFYVVAKSFFNVGEYVPVTAVVANMKTDKYMSAMEEFEGEHFYSSKPSNDCYIVLQKMGNSGVLEKLAIMDFVMGNCDRTHINYMLSPKNESIGLIDNAFIFNFKDEIVPSYVLDFVKHSGKKINDIAIQQSTIDWVGKLDVFSLKEQLVSLGATEDDANKCSARLLSIQTEVLSGTNKLLSILLAHKNFLNPVQPNAEDNI